MNLWKMKTSAKIVLFSSLICVIEMILLVKTFPKTGLSRVIFIPFFVSLNLILTIILVRFLNGKSKKIIITSVILTQICLFLMYLWFWPQSSAIEKNLIYEFYQRIL